MGTYLLGFWSGLLTAVGLYIMFRIGRELWFAVEWDTMYRATKREMEDEK